MLRNQLEQLQLDLSHRDDRISSMNETIRDLKGNKWRFSVSTMNNNQGREQLQAQIDTLQSEI